MAQQGRFIAVVDQNQSLRHVVDRHEVLEKGARELLKETGQTGLRNTLVDLLWQRFKLVRLTE